MAAQSVRMGLLAAVLLLVGAATVHISPSAEAAADPDLEAQLVVYEINRARRDPSAFAAEVSMTLPAEVLPRPAMAINSSLQDSSDLKANEMAEYRYFSHQSEVTGKWPNQIAREAGFPLPSWWSDDANYIESLNSGSVDPLLVVKSFAGSPSHRRHIFGEGTFAQYREIGVGRSDASNYWAVHSSMRAEPRLFVTGVVFADDDGDGRLDLGEGLPGITVQVGSQSVVTGPGGGYSLIVGNGSHTITASGPGLAGPQTAAFQVSGYNVQVDFRSGLAPLVLPYGLCNGLEPTILGTDGADVIEGTAGRDVIHGFGGDDIIFGLDGDDIICGGDGDDTIDGGQGKDRIWGGGGNDVIDGGRGADRLFGGDGSDLINGQGGRDRLRGNGADDDLWGGSGADRLIHGGSGYDECGVARTRRSCEA